MSKTHPEMLKMLAFLEEMLGDPKEMLAISKRCLVIPKRCLHISKRCLHISKHLDPKLQMLTSAWRDTARDFHNRTPLQHPYNSNLRVLRCFDCPTQLHGKYQRTRQESLLLLEGRLSHPKYDSEDVETPVNDAIATLHCGNWHLVFNINSIWLRWSGIRNISYYIISRLTRQWFRAGFAKFELTWLIKHQLFHTISDVHGQSVGKLPNFKVIYQNLSLE